MASSAYRATTTTRSLFGSASHADAPDEGALVIPLLSPPGHPFAIGHRGAMGHAPENTMASFRRGWELGAGLLELDVHPSAGGELVVIHDETLDRTTNGHGFIHTLTVEQIKQVDAGAWYDASFAGEHVPLLGEVIDWARGKVGLAVEIKNGPMFYPGIAELVVRELEEREFVDEVLVISFDHQVLHTVKDLNRRLRTGMLYAARLFDPVRAAREVKADAVRPRHDYLAAADVPQLHAAGIAVSPWSVQDEAGMRRVIDMGVDSMGTNFPDRLVRLLEGT
ncbi:MAG: glycerophosphodiester phosphodiesterase [Chloroflexi bacterium]|nr:glycerophosphodiester phosphodiesterase [Chloroflexota bacterium]